MNTPSDKVYRDQRESIGDFRFDKSVATVFDDMVSRSVPFYGEIQRMVVEIAADYAEPGSSVYDLGCSSGTTLVALNPQVDDSVRFVGIDNSERHARQVPGEVRRREVRAAGGSRTSPSSTTACRSRTPRW